MVFDCGFKQTPGRSRAAEWCGLSSFRVWVAGAIEGLLLFATCSAILGGWRAGKRLMLGPGTPIMVLVDPSFYGVVRFS